MTTFSADLRNWVSMASANLIACREAAEPAWPTWGGNRITLAVSESGKSLTITPCRGPEGQRAPIDAFAGAELDRLVETIRQDCHYTSWPFMVELEMGHDQGFLALRIRNIGLAGAMPRSDRHLDGALAEEVIEASQLLGRLIRPSGRPIQAWSTMSSLTGEDIVHVIGVHARTEPEVVLKRLYMACGVNVLRDIVEMKPLPEGEWLTRSRFVASELHDLDENPIGRHLTGADALNDIREALRYLEPENEPATW